MAEILRIKTEKKYCETVAQHIDIIEIYKDIMDGESLITSFLTEVSCLRFQHCSHPKCALKSNFSSLKLHPVHSKKKPAGV